MHAAHTEKSMLSPIVADIEFRKALCRDSGMPLPKEFPNAHSYYGIHHIRGGWVYREWFPNVQQVYLIGEFNNWDLNSHPMTDIGNGNWVLTFPGDDALWEGCKVKTVVDVNEHKSMHIPLCSKSIRYDSLRTIWCAEVVDDAKL